MKCEICGNEMLLYRVTEKENGALEKQYVCANKKCPRYDERLKKKQESIEQAEA